MNQKLYLCAAAILLSCVGRSAFADGGQPAPGSGGNFRPSQKSENFDKTKKFLPGEEVVSPTGQKMKIWSTEGPVPVSPPPQPFDDPSKGYLPPGANVVLDNRYPNSPDVMRNRNSNLPPAPDAPAGGNVGTGGLEQGDSFGVEGSEEGR